jgi:hypothetical protein
VLISEDREKHPDIDPLDRERRFLPSSAQLAAFIEAVRAGPLPDADRVERPASTVWTTYLDTDDLRCFHSCEGPVARRLRIREYDVGSGRGAATPCYLELKQTMGTTRSKVRLGAPVAVLARLIEGAGDFDGVFTNTGGIALRAIQQALSGSHFGPCVGTSYQRRLLASGPGLRVTLDEGLTFIHPVTLGLPHGNRAALALGPPRVLEVKYAARLPDWLGRALEALDAAPALSKFQLGMAAVQHAAASVASAAPVPAEGRHSYRSASIGFMSDALRAG